MNLNLFFLFKLKKIIRIMLGKLTSRLRLSPEQFLIIGDKGSKYDLSEEEANDNQWLGLKN